MNALVSIDNILEPAAALAPATLFGSGQVETILSAIEKDVRAEAYDIATPDGRERIKSVAYKIARSKTTLDDLGKEHVAEIKKQSAAIDAERRAIRDRLDALKEEFLQRFSRAEAVDPGACRLGFDPAKAWFLQELAGVPLPRLWNAAGRDGRRELRALVAEALGGARAPRILAPDVIGIEPGRVLAPRILGGAQGSPDALFAALDRAAPAPGAGGRERPWDGPPDLPGGSRTLLRGRSRELTYLKSLVLGLGASAPMERVLVLLGEEGLGHDRLCD